MSALERSGDNGPPPHQPPVAAAAPAPSASLTDPRVPRSSRQPAPASRFRAENGGRARVPRESPPLPGSVATRQPSVSGGASGQLLESQALIPEALLVLSDLAAAPTLPSPPQAGRVPAPGVGLVVVLDSRPASWCAVNDDEVQTEELVLQSPLPDGSAGDAHLQLGCSVVKDVEDIEGLTEGCDDEKTPQKLLGPSSESACIDISAATAALEAEAGWEHVERGHRFGRGAPPVPSREGLERSLAFKRWARGRCFRCLERGHQVHACHDSFRCIRCRRPGHRERFCRAHSPVARDRSPVARVSSPVSQAHHQRSRSPFVQPCSSQTRCWAEVVSNSSLHVSVPPRSQYRCRQDSNASAFLVSALESQFALLRTELLQEVELLRTELRDALAKLQVASVVPLVPELQSGSTDEVDECFFGEFSPRAVDGTSSVHGGVVITEVVAPVLQIMPELQELCGESAMVQPMKPGSLESLASPSPSESCQPLAFVDSGCLDGSFTLSSMPIGHEVSLSDEVDETGVLAPNSDALSCEQLEMSESIVSVASVVDDV